jgi:peptidoglycan/xylan/chitin deacetylase (PgdA/CDA1 family)
VDDLLRPVEVAGARGTSGRVRVLALLYHDVVHDGRFDLSGFQSPDADIYKLSRAEFERHLTAISDNASAPLGTAIDLLSRQASRPPMLLTFDDGGASALHIADRLEAHGWTGHFLVTTDYVGTPGFLTAPNLRELVRRGHVVGSHSMSHPARMSSCSAEQLEREWSGSVTWLADALGAPVTVASVPGGYYSRAVAAAASRAGIRVLFNSEPVMRVHEVQGCLIVGRFGVQQGVPSEWIAAVVRGERGPRARRYLHWNAKKLLKTLGGDEWLRLRRRLIAARTTR